MTARPVLDLLFDKDERNRAFPVTAVADPATLRSKTWRTGPVTDQGSEGACVGHGWTGALTGSPARLRLEDPDQYALGFYEETKQHDEWPGEDYSGTSVKAGGQTARRRGLLPEYRWAFGLEQTLKALQLGPVVLGVPWYEGMYEAPYGKVRITGEQVGGHCLYLYSVNVKTKTCRWKNSWGKDYGVNGVAVITWDDLDRLLKEGGEACVPMLREVGALSQ